MFLVTPIKVSLETLKVKLTYPKLTVGEDVSIQVPTRCHHCNHHLFKSCTGGWITPAASLGWLCDTCSYPLLTPSYREKVSSLRDKNTLPTGDPIELSDDDSRYVGGMCYLWEDWRKPLQAFEDAIGQKNVQLLVDMCGADPILHAIRSTRYAFHCAMVYGDVNIAYILACPTFSLGKSDLRWLVGSLLDRKEYTRAVWASQPLYSKDEKETYSTRYLLARSFPHDGSFFRYAMPEEIQDTLASLGVTSFEWLTMDDPWELIVDLQKLLILK